jgi:hypothetical protein
LLHTTSTSYTTKPELHPPHVDSKTTGNANYTVRGYGDALFDDLFDSQRIDFSFLETQYKGKSLADPLPDAYFEPIHKKAERLERSIRNTEKGRAQHEKDQIIRLLEGLQGHDWLRTMGVSGITETRKRTFEPARQHFIKGCQMILEKFRIWNLEEKRRKLKKGRALAQQAEADAEADADQNQHGEEVSSELEDEDNGDEAVESDAQEDAREDDAADDDDEDDKASDGDPPDYSDVDASIAKQLHEEALARVRIANAGKRGSRKTRTAAEPKPISSPSPQPPKEITSFFAKKYEREGALNRHRRGGRKVVAWGQPIPEIPEIEFDLPKEYRDEELMKVHARQRRREKREGKH